MPVYRYGILQRFFICHKWNLRGFKLRLIHINRDLTIVFQLYFDEAGFCFDLDAGLVC